MRRAQQREDIRRAEAHRVHTAALAWRNGLGVMLAGLLGFGLVKGRSNVGDLESPAAIIVGTLLLAALVTGTVGALMLLRAAHGRPTVVAAGSLAPAVVLDHLEALTSARLLRRGTVATLACAGLLVAGVALTWYGPAHAQPVLQIDQSDGSSLCGSVIRTGHGILVLSTASGERTVLLTDTVGLRPVPACGS
ncbi:hypothetical protein [Streptomyces murinus]|uniref:hypothetical protein n=1 Tax=Streptomyces murinus TaxID=33900 RepID=UPI003828531A